MQKILYILCCCILSISTLSAQIDAQEAELLGSWKVDSLVGSSAYNNTYNEIWGIARNGHEYAIIGSTAGTHFIDVTNPNQPEETFFLSGKFNGPAIIHRDYHDVGDYLYAVADEGPSSLQIIDISQLPDAVEIIYDSNEWLERAHNIFIDETHKRLYAFAVKGGVNSYSAMRIYDIADPLDIKLLGNYGSLGNVDIGHVHDGYVRDNIAFLNCGNDGFAVVDFTDPLRMELLNFLHPNDYPQAGYNHSGWLNDACTHYYMADETWARDMKTLDITQIDAIQTTSTFDAASDSEFSIAHNLVVACNYLYVSHYYDGLQVYDISDAANPERVLYYATSKIGHRNSYEGAWGVYPLLPSGNILVSDMQEGLFILAGMDDNCDPNANILPCQFTSALERLDETRNSIELYPQPSREHCTLDMDLATSRANVQIQLHDWTGRLLQTLWAGDLAAGQQQLTLNLPKTAAGMYILRLQNEEMFLAKKIVIH